MTDYSHYVRCRRVEHERVARRQASFDFEDAKGRIIGYRVLIDRELWMPEASSYSSWDPQYVGRPIWRVMPNALRNGASYGAILNAAIFLNEEDALAKAEAMIEAYRKKMAKQFA